MGVFLFSEGGIGDSVWVVDVGMRGGSSGVVGRHVLVVWLVGVLLE